jgi:subtilisin
VTLLEVLGSRLEALREGPLAPVEVAVLDTGIDSTHPDLVGRVVEAVEIVLDDGRHRAAGRTHSANNDAVGHGTAVASIIAGIAPNARLVGIQVIGSNDLGAGASLVAGLRFAVLRRFRVLNLSLACSAEFDQPLTELCEQAYWQDQLVVAARRNMPLLDHGIPARFSSCIGVDSDRLPSPYALRFRARHPVEWVASGQDVTVAAADGNYAVQTGTSFAAPVVAGLCAVLVGAYPDLTPFEIKSALKTFSEADEGAR